MKRKYKALLIILFSMIILSLIIVLSYAYYAIIQKNYTDIMINVYDENSYKMYILGRGDLNFYIDEYAMQEHNEDTYAIDSSIGYLLYLPLDQEYASTANTVCSFDYVWKWSEDSDLYVPTEEGEFTITNPDGEIFNVTGENTNLGSGSLGTLSTSTRALSFNIKYKNYANIDQSINDGKSLKGKVDIDNVNCVNNATDTVMDEHAKLIDAIRAMSSYDSYVEHDVFSPGYYLNYDLETGIPSGENGIVDYGYYGMHYVGDNPDNYITLNDGSNNIWRIIGAMNDANDSQYVKVTNIDPIGSALYDLKYENTESMLINPYWGDSQLNAMLNGGQVVFNNLMTAKNECALNDNCKAPTKQYCYTNNYLSMGDDSCDTVIAYTPGSVYEGSTSVYIPHSVYQGQTTTWTNTMDNVGGVITDKLRTMIATVKGYQNYNEANYNATGVDIYAREHHKSDEIWYGNIMIPYLSDFALAGSGSESLSRQESTSNERNLGFNLENNWMLNMSEEKGDYLTMSAYDAALATINTETGLTQTDWSDYFDVDNYYILPVFYLDPDVVIISGLGTEKSPYILDLES